MFDIVGSLPLELLAYVVKYLGPADIFQSRRVCIGASFVMES